MQQHTLRAEDEFPAPILFDLGYRCVDAVHLINDDSLKNGWKKLIKLFMSLLRHP